MANTFRGKAQIAGITGTIAIADVVVYPLRESVSLTHEFDEDIIKDEQGNDAAWRAFNERNSGRVGMRLVDVGSPTSKANIEDFCAALTPYAKITFAGTEPSVFDGDYQLVSGSERSLTNTTAGTMTLTLRQYVDATQQLLSVTDNSGS